MVAVGLARDGAAVGEGEPEKAVPTNPSSFPPATLPSMTTEASMTSLTGSHLLREASAVAVPSDPIYLLFLQARDPPSRI